MSASARTGPPGPAGSTGPAGPAGPSSDISGEATARQAADATLADAAAAAQATASAALPKAGGTMTGKIVLDGDPTANLHPATRQYVLAQITALINGAPGALDTLKEIADQLASDETAASALASTVAGKLAAASNLSDQVNAATARTNLGLGSAATHPAGDFDISGAAAAAQAASQPLDSDLTAIAALTTTAFGRGLLALADAAALLAAIGAASASGLTAEAAARTAADALLIPKSLVDAKGDVLVATADDTPTRLAVGTDGQVLTADAAQTAGIKWATAASGYARPKLSQQWYVAAEAYVASVSVLTQSLLTLAPIELAAGTTLDRIGLNQQGAGVAGVTGRLGVYKDNGKFYPGDLLVDAGTVDLSTAANVKTITIATAIPADGVYWIGGVPQGGTPPSTINIGNSSQQGVDRMPVSTNLFSKFAGFGQTGVTGALPATFSTTVTLTAPVLAAGVRVQ